MHPIRIMIIDDHRVFAEAVAVRLGREPGLTVLPLAYDADQAVALLVEHVPDVLLLDLSLGEHNGTAVLDQVRARELPTRVVILTAAWSLDQLVEAVRHGASAWLPKTLGGDQLVRVIRGAARGEGWIPPELLADLLARLVTEAREEPPAALSKLTPRESEVLQCLVDGLPRAEVARKLFLSTDTVRTHTQNLLAKLGVHSALEAVALGTREGMRPSS